MLDNPAISRHTHSIRVRRNERLAVIDKATGIAILLVVYGHFIFPETLSIGWYSISMEFIYKFHMALFMCLSGFVVFLSTSKKSFKTHADYLQFQRRKIIKFLPPYLFFSFLSIMVDIFYHHQTIAEVSNSIFFVFFSPNDGSAHFVWYLYVLTIFYFITPFLLKLNKSQLYLLLTLAFVLTTLTPSHLFSTDLACKFFFFFLAGGLIYKDSEKFFYFIKRNGILIIVSTAILIIIDLSNNLIIPYQLLSIATILSVFYISSLKWPRLITKAFITIGISSFAIYLFNTTILNLYLILFKLLRLKIDGLFILSCTILAVIVSILIRSTFNKIVPTKVYTL
ncbi:acyltransferase [Ilyomonas limi]|uniref:Acyltransferase n=1 Tax=Ilyomonas limi TaxID=2575867 RepID=A0A4U3L5V4_9BACT|nr:acyltransferase [Ilyomonas limi]